MRAELENGRVVCAHAYGDRELLKQLPGAQYDPEQRVWHAPLSWATCIGLRALFHERLDIGPLLTEWAWHELHERVEPCTQLRTLLAQDEGDAALFPFQRVGVTFLRTAKRALLADEMGTGKSVQTAVALDGLEDAYPVLIICPNSMKRTWAREFARWAPEARCHLIMGGATGRRKSLAALAAAVEAGEKAVGVINWEAVRLHARLAPYGSVRLTDTERTPKELNAIPWATVVADEAHRMKDPKAKQTRATWSVAHGPSVHYAFALTGTPIANAPDDLWSILHFIDAHQWPYQGEGRSRWNERYCLWAWNGWGQMEVIGVKPETAAEFQRIVDPVMRRMPKALVLPQLPRKLRERRWVEMGPKQAKAYAEMTKHMVALLDSGDLAATTVLAQLTRKMQFASAYAHIDSDGLHLSEPSCKVDALMDVLDELGDEPVVVAAQSRQLIELAAARLTSCEITYEKIVGGMTEMTREHAREVFQDGKVRAMLLTEQAGGEGITLTRAGTIIFLQRSWSSLHNTQTEDRVHRIGSESHDKILVVDLVTQNTVEEHQLNVLANKAMRLEEIVRDRALLREVLLS